MAWIFLADPVASVLRSIPGSDPLPIVRTIDTPKLFCSHACEAHSCQSRQSGMMFGPYQVQDCRQWISSPEDFHARTSLLLALELAWMESEVDCFSTSFGSLASYDQDSFSWRTSQQSLFEDLNEFVWSSLSSGMIVDGRLYRPKSLEPRIYAKDGSFLPRLQTPRPCSGKRSSGMNRTEIMNGLKRWPTPLATDTSHRKEKFKQGGTALSTKVGGSLNPAWVEWLMGYNTEWTVLESWAIAWFRPKREKRLKD